MNQRKATAIHEAGHAVAAMELGVMFTIISIVPGEGYDGRVLVEGGDYFIMPLGTDPYSPENERAFRAWAEQQAIIDYAGHAAIVAVLGVGDMSYRSACQHGAWDDFSKASQRLRRDYRRIVAARDRAKEIVQTRKRHVRMLAQALMEQGRLDGQSAEMLLEARR